MKTGLCTEPAEEDKKKARAIRVVVYKQNGLGMIVLLGLCQAPLCCRQGSLRLCWERAVLNRLYNDNVLQL
ncbi:hypothetical protein ACET3Z_024812 [Daucus carota]